MRGLAVVVSLAASSALATTYQVGPGQTYTSPCVLLQTAQLQPGDIIQVEPGTYVDACQVTPSGSAQQPITMVGLPTADGGRPLFNPPSSLDLSGAGSVPRAIFQFTGGSYWLVQHLELENATGSSGNAAAFRATAGSHDIVIQDASIHNNQDGVMSDGVATVTIMDSDLYANGIGNGFTHNLYMQGDTTILIGNHIHDSNGGQNVKLRSPYAVLLYNRIENAGNYEIDLIQNPPQTDAPNSNAVLIGNVVARPPTSGNNSQVILFGTDNTGQNARNGSLYAVNNTFVMGNGSNRLFHAINPVAGSQIVLTNNIITANVSGTGMATDATTSGIIVGQNNWVNTNVTQAGTLMATITEADAGFVGNGDYDLLAGSGARDLAFASPTYVGHDGGVQSAIPTLEFSPPQGTVPRPDDCTLDIGAYEYDSGVFCTPDGGSSDGGGGNPGGGGHPGGGGVPSPNPPPSGGCHCGETSGLGGLLLLLTAALFRVRRVRARVR